MSSTYDWGQTIVVFLIYLLTLYLIVCARYRWSTLLPKLQSLDTLLSTITWRQRLVAQCFNSHLCTAEERDMIMHWSGEGLGGLRWEVITDFCRKAACLT